MKARENPFSTERIEGLSYRFTDTAIGDVLEKYKTLQYRAAIIGPKGSGKTTLLENIEETLVGNGDKVHRIFINDTVPFTKEQQNHLADTLTPDTLLLLDGADCIGFSAWKRLDSTVRSKAKGLLITSHNKGPLPALLKCSTSLQLLTQLANELTASNPQPEPELLARIYRRCRGNLRECFRNLYDIYAAL